MKIIDAHMHYFNMDRFEVVAKNAGYENTAACWQQICEENHIAFSVAMGNTYYTSARYGGIPPRMIDLAAPFDETYFNQPDNIGYCMGVESEQMNEANAEATAHEFEHYINDAHCMGFKLYPGYNAVYVNDRRHWPLFELARAYKLPVVIHTGNTARRMSYAKYAHPLTVDEAAVDFPDVQFVIAHCGCPWFADAAEVAGRNSNVAIDLSGLMEGQPKPLHIFEEHAGFWRQLHTWLNYMGNYHKVMYGSDWPLVNIPLYIRTIANVIPEKHLENVFYNNALRIFRKIQPLIKEE